MLQTTLEKIEGKLPKRLRYLTGSPRYVGKWLRPDTRFFVESYYRAMCALHPREFEERRRLANSLAAEVAEPIDPDRGYLSQDLGHLPEIQAALARCDALRASPQFMKEVNKSKKSKFLGAFEFSLADPEDQAIFALACHPAILGPIAQYLGTVPVLHRAALSYSPNKVMVGQSQRYHFDVEDLRQIKCFVFPEEITLESGPLTVIPAKDSQAIYKALWRNGQKRGLGSPLDDETVYGATAVNSGVPMCGRRGQVLYVDTCNCYHFGSRPAKRERCVLYFHFASAYSIEMPTWARRARDPVGQSKDVDRAAWVRELVFSLYDSHFARRERKA